MFKHCVPEFNKTYDEIVEMLVITIHLLFSIDGDFAKQLAIRIFVSISSVTYLCSCTTFGVHTETIGEGSDLWTVEQLRGESHFQ